MIYPESECMQSLWYICVVTSTSEHMCHPGTWCGKHVMTLVMSW